MIDEPDTPEAQQALVEAISQISNAVKDFEINVNDGDACWSARFGFGAAICAELGITAGMLDAVRYRLQQTNRSKNGGH